MSGARVLPVMMIYAMMTVWRGWLGARHRVAAGRSGRLPPVGRPPVLASPMLVTDARLVAVFTP